MLTNWSIYSTKDMRRARMAALDAADASYTSYRYLGYCLPHHLTYTCNSDSRKSVAYTH